MNKERILALADLIEQQPHTTPYDKSGFDLSSYTHDCGTPSCIAGWAAWEAAGRPEKLIMDPGKIIELAQTYLGLDEHECDIFCGECGTPRLSKVTPQTVALLLREFVETEEVPFYFLNMKVKV